MRILERIENRLHWIAFPGLFKWMMMLGAVVFASQLANPQLSEIIAFDRNAIIAGEWWRIITFIFDPGIGFSPLGSLFFFFAVMIAFLIDNSLEQVWSTTRITLYILVSWISIGAALWFMPVFVPGAGSYLFTCMFFAFATYFPRYEFLLFLVIPVQVRFLAWLSFGLLLFSGISNPYSLILLLGIVLPYLIWVLPEYISGRKNLVVAAAKRKSFEAKSMPEKEAFHRCETCDRTELTNPELDFRTMEDGTEYCVEHLPPH